MDTKCAPNANFSKNGDNDGDGSGITAFALSWAWVDAEEERGTGGTEGAVQGVLMQS